MDRTRNRVTFSLRLANRTHPHIITAGKTRKAPNPKSKIIVSVMKHPPVKFYPSSDSTNSAGENSSRSFICSPTPT